LGAEKLHVTVSDIVDVDGETEVAEFMLASDGSADLKAGRVGYGVVVVRKEGTCCTGAAPREVDMPADECPRLVLAVGTPMPRRWGASKATNNLAEGRSLNLALDILPPQVSAIVVTDSQIWYDACASLARGKGAKKINQRMLRSDWRSELGRMAHQAATRMAALEHLQGAVDSAGDDGADEWITGGVQIWGGWCADDRCVEQVWLPADEVMRRREQWHEVAMGIVQQNEAWTDLVATVLVVAAQKQAEQGERSNWLIIAKAWAGRVVVKIKSHIDKIRAEAREKGAEVPDYPQEEAAIANIHADVVSSRALSCVCA